MSSPNSLIIGAMTIFRQSQKILRICPLLFGLTPHPTQLRYLQRY